MNKIYKVIYSKVRHCYVVVSEIARNQGKAHSIHTGLTAGLCALALGLSLGLAVPVLVQAANPVSLNNGASANYDANGNLTIGKNVKAEGKNNSGSNNTVIGTNTDTTRDDGTGNGQALDNDANTKLVDGEGQVHELNRSTESSGDTDKGSTAVGYDSHAEGDASTAIGNKAKVLNKPVTYYADADGDKTTDMDKAAYYADASGKPTKVPQVFRDADNNTTSTPQYVHTYTETDATTGQTVTKREITTDATKADKDGNGNPVYNYQKADNKDKLYSVTLYQPSSNSIAAGSEVKADGENAVAVGYQSTAKSSAVAIGDNANAEKDSVAIGKQATASVEGGVALGMGSTANRAGGIAGWDPKTGTTSTNTTSAWKSGNGAVSVGNENGSRQITNVAAGSEDSDAVNVAQLKKSMIHYYSVKTTEETDQAGNNNYLNDGATGDNALAAGVNAKAFGDNSTAVGTESQAQGRNAAAYGYKAIAFQEDSTAMGSNAQAQARSSTAYGSSAIAKAVGSTVIGYGATSQGENSVAVGGHALADYSVQIGTSSTSQGKYSVAVGGQTLGENTVAVGVGTTAQGKDSVAVGGHSLGENSVQVGKGGTSQGKNSVAVGGSSLGENTVEVGIGSTAQGANSVSVGGHSIGASSTAIGNGSNSAGTSSTAIGGGSTHNDYETAVGSGSVTSGGKSVAVGGTATGSQSVSVGNNSNATSENATTVGFNTSATGSQSTALGYGAHAGNYQSVAIGGSTANGNQAVAIGNGAAAGSYNSGYSGMTAVGQNSHANGNGSTALGNSANAGGTNSTSISNSNTSGDYNTAIGGASTNGQYTIGIGWGATAANDYSIALGNNSNVSGTGSVGIGSGTKASNSGTAVGNGVQAGGYNSTAVGVGSMATGQYAAAIGGGKAWSDYSVAIGSGAGTNTNAVSIGKDSNAWGENGVSLGTGSSATGKDSTAIGGGKANSDDGIAIGSNAQTNKAITIGKDSSAWGDSAIAIGEGADAWRTNSIVIGRNSKSGADKNVQGFDPLTGKASTDSSATWNSTDEAVSFGRAEERDANGNVTKTAITRQLNNVAAGTQDTDAVNVAQLKLATTKINMHYYSVHSTETGDGSNYANDGATGTNALAVGVKASASGASSVAMGDSAAATAEGGVALGKGSKANTAASDVAGYDVITGTAFAGTTGTSAASPVWHSTSGAVSVGDVAGGLTRRINGVAAGSEDTDAVNVAQLKQVKQAIDTVENHHSTVEAGTSGNVTVTEGTNAAGGKKYTVDLNNNVNFGKDDKQISINGDNGTVTIGQGDKQIKLDSKDGSITAGGVTINKDENGTVNGLTNKEWDGKHITSGQAATEDQLQKVEQNVNTKIDNVNNKVDKVAKQHTTVSVNGGNAQGNLVMETTDATDEKGANYDISLSNDVTIGTQGEDGKDGKLTVQSKDGTRSITTNGNDGTLTFKDGSNEVSMKAAESAKGVDGTTDIKRVAIDNHTVATLDDGMKFAGDSGEALKQKLNSTTNIKGGATGELTDGNIGVVSNGKDTLTVKLAKDIKGLDSVETKTVNTNTVNIAGDSSHSAITIQQGKVNMGGNTISGVAPGKISADSTEAVNGSQLYAQNQTIGKLGDSVNRLDNKINRAGAGAAALAALHPQDFDPDDKWDFAAGYGNYHGASAAAIGAFYRPTEDVMVSVGGSMGGGENMVNAGVTFKLGQHNHVSNSRVAMAKEIRDLKATVGQLTQMVNQLTGNTGGRTLPLKKGDTLFPDVPRNHWAYDYVTKLAQAGLLEGYPDGEFKGDRMMTRYEFATLLYRAVMAGAAGNPKLNQDGTLDKLVDEFGDELQYIRIAVVERDKNGKPTIERVRTVEDDKRHHHKEANA